jgi:phosphatidylinositol kinase/protein kinase (PI-3  family)
LLITKDGNFFHVGISITSLNKDYGFILGDDPKLSPPPIRLTSEMVEAMGTFREFGEFKKICCNAYQIIRKKCSNMILNSLLAMTKGKWF